MTRSTDDQPPRPPRQATPEDIERAVNGMPLDVDSAHGAPVVDYRSPNTPRAIAPSSPFVTFAKFIGGILAGIAITAAFLFLAYGGEAMLPLLLVSLITKFVIAAVLRNTTRWRSFGIGIICSIPLIALTFGGGVAYIVYTCKPI